MEETTVKPLYVRLNSKRTQGEWTITDNTYPYPCEYIIKANGGDIIHVGNTNNTQPKIKDKSNAEYTVLAVNNLAPLANLVSEITNLLPTIDANVDALAFLALQSWNNRAKEALARIS